MRLLLLLNGLLRMHTIYNSQTLLSRGFTSCTTTFAYGRKSETNLLMLFFPFFFSFFRLFLWNVFFFFPQIQLQSEIVGDRRISCYLTGGSGLVHYPWLALIIAQFHMIALMKALCGNCLLSKAQCWVSVASNIKRKRLCLIYILNCDIVTTTICKIA